MNIDPSYKMYTTICSAAHNILPKEVHKDGHGCGEWSWDIKLITRVLIDDILGC